MMTAAQIVQRAQTGWPYDAVPYSQSGIWNDDDGSGPHIGGYRMDCSGFATLAAGLPAPGLTTVTFLTTGAVRLITWADLAAGDFVGALGPGTAGDAGHIMVVESVNRSKGTYTVLEQAGYGDGPDRNTFRIGDGQGRNYLPYRLSNLEDEMPLTPEERNIVDATDRRVAAALITGTAVIEDVPGYGSGTKVWAVDKLNGIDGKLDKLSTGGVDVDALVAALVPALAASPDFTKAIAKAVNDDAAARLAE